MRIKNLIPAMLLAVLCLLAACATQYQNWTHVGPAQSITSCPRCGSFVELSQSQLTYSDNGSKMEVVTLYRCLSTITCGLVSGATNDYVLTVKRLASPKAQ